MTEAMIRAEGLTKIFNVGSEEIRALDDVSFSIQHGESLAIMGPSGSGKSTLMSIIGCLDVANAGTYELDGEKVEQLSDARLADIRGRKIGFVFQQFNLLARTSALENVMLPLTYTNLSGKQIKERAMAALKTVGLAERVKHTPSELSGGQQQRVAIARAIVNQPAILIADEPTGALDSKTGIEIMQLFQDLHQKNGQTVIMVTHDLFVARHTNRVIILSDGKIKADEFNQHVIKAGTDRSQIEEYRI